MSDKNRQYEAFYIVRPEFSDSDVQKIADRYKSIVEENGGSVEVAGKWDKRKLAYEIKGCKEGTYVLMNFTAPAPVPAELNRLMKISDDVLRQMILIQDKPVAAPSEPPVPAAAAEPPTPAAPVATE